jgi:hypothetical protein
MFSAFRQDNRELCILNSLSWGRFSPHDVNTRASARKPSTAIPWEGKRTPIERPGHTVEERMIAEI